MATNGSKNRVAPVPQGFRTITPHIVVRGAQAAIEFYHRAFGAKVDSSIVSSDGATVRYAKLRIGNSLVTISDEQPSAGLIAPIYPHAGGVTLHLYVDDVETWWPNALEAGASIDTPLFDTYWGDRLGVLIDPFGHRWTLATRITKLSQQEIEERARAIFEEAPATIPANDAMSEEVV